MIGTLKPTVLAALCALCMGAGAQERYIKQVTFPAGASAGEKIEMASRLVPSPKQLDWQNLEFTAFLHFGVNTFTDREWGDGTEDPAIFNPVDLDAEQWVKTLKDSGVKLVILTAKHHDGFCLWPTKTTSHSVASSPWKDGKGDVVAELRKACDKYGLKLGLYLSPWDRNAPCYGDSPAYNDMFVAQLTELLSNYGKIDEVWFDGACGEGPNGKKQVYDWQRFKKVIEELQPTAVVAIQGDDVRWVGNEKGMGRETEWTATAFTPGILPESEENNAKLGLFAKAPDLGSRDIVAKADKLYWWPSEVDVSIRPGWFYHDKEQPKSLRNLAEIYLNSVGRNSVLLLNIPPDRRGLIADADVKRLAELKAWIDDNFTNNLVKSYDGKSLTASLSANGADVNTVMLGEDIAKGQQVEKFSVSAKINGKWQEVAQGSTIGHKRILMFPTVKATAMRLDIVSHRGPVDINLFQAFDVTLPEAQNEVLAGYRLMPQTNWSILDAPGKKSCAYKAIDGSADSFWTSPKEKGEKTLAIDLKKTVPVAGFVYTPRSGDDKTGTIYHYRFETSENGCDWTAAKVSGEFSNIKYNPLVQWVYLPSPVTARYVRLVAVDEIDGQDFVTVGDLGILMPDTRTAPVDNENLVWKFPNAGAGYKPGQAHPSVKGWKFLTSQEFDTPIKGIPAGWQWRPGEHAGRYARTDVGSCYEVRDGYLRLRSMPLGFECDNGYGRPVKYATYSIRTIPEGRPGHWITFRPGQRIEVRARVSDQVGLNDAIWFMSNDKKPWPEGGEIDLLEIPKTPGDRNTIHFTLHTANHHAPSGDMGGTGSTTANTKIQDPSNWNIYWIELEEDEIRGGVNGLEYFRHHRGDNGNTDWPWLTPDGYYMIFTSCLSQDPGAWAGEIIPEEWDPDNLPHMDIDWIRIFEKQ